MRFSASCDVVWAGPLEMGDSLSPGFMRLITAEQSNGCQTEMLRHFTGRCRAPRFELKDVERSTLASGCLG